MGYELVDLGNLRDVDLSTLPPEDLQSLVYDEDTGTWVPGEPRVSSTIPAIVYANTPPADPDVGTIFISKTGQGINPDGTFV